MGTRRLTLRTAAAAAALLLAACSAPVEGSGSRESTAADPSGSSTPLTPSTPSSSGTSAPSPSDAAGPVACPTSYAAPDPDRPRVDLRFVVSADHGTVRGVETVTFRPDKPVTELVFRLTANTKPSVRQGNSIRVTSATATPAGGRFRFSEANAAATTQGGLLRIPLGRTVRPGQQATARIGFVVALGRDSFDRFGRSGEFAYFGSAQPLLAWERGFGWHTEDLIDFTAESATSEAMDTTLHVTAPAKDTVIASGNPADPPRSGATRTWNSHLAAARDVAVSVGPFAVGDTTVQGVKLRVGAYAGSVRDALVPEFRRAIVELAKLYGPFPFPSLAVARVPAQGGGIEYPGAILMLDGSRLVTVHETAHEWFYAMVGDSQSLHPWLDEAFAQYSEELVDDAPSHERDLAAPNDVDRSTQSYGSDANTYYFTTYNKGSAALAAARKAAGPAKWDTALRCYVARNAWRIVNPDDLRAALKNLPAAIAVLEKAGALR